MPTIHDAPRDLTKVLLKYGFANQTMAPSKEVLKNIVLPDAMDIVAHYVGRKIDLDDFYFYLEHGVVPRKDRWRNDGEDPRGFATISTVVTHAFDFIAANDHYALAICHVETFPLGNGFMPRFYSTRLINIRAQQQGVTLRWDDKGNLFAIAKDGKEYQTHITFRHLESKGNGEAYRMKFYADAYQTAVDEGLKQLAKDRADDIKEEEEYDTKHEARLEKKAAEAKAAIQAKAARKLACRKARRQTKKFKHRQWKRAKQ